MRILSGCKYVCACVFPSKHYAVLLCLLLVSLELGRYAATAASIIVFTSALLSSSSAESPNLKMIKCSLNGVN